MMKVQRIPHAPMALIAGAGLFALGTAVSAEMSLDPTASSVSMLSTKVLADGSQSVVERFAFADISGSVSDDGMATVSIPLDTLETSIPIRNERMAEHLFETDQYPEATITAQVPADMMAAGTRSGTLNAELSLHGESQSLEIPVNVHSSDGQVVVSASEPVLVDASAYNLDGGIGKLQELAKLLHIPTTVPVSFSVTFSNPGS